jgi:hypothetical protein
MRVALREDIGENWLRKAGQVWNVAGIASLPHTARPMRILSLLLRVYLGSLLCDDGGLFDACSWTVGGRRKLKAVLRKRERCRRKPTQGKDGGGGAASSSV